jgi:hypothetical protein
MPTWLIWIIGIVYAIVAILLWKEGKVGLSIAFWGYVVGNIGLGLAAMDKG